MAENIRNIATRAALESAFNELRGHLAGIADIEADFCVFQDVTQNMVVADAMLSSTPVVAYDSALNRFIATSPDNVFDGYSQWLGCEKFGAQASDGVVPNPAKLYYGVAEGLWYAYSFFSMGLEPIDRNTIGWPNGVAPLDSERKVPMKHLPTRTCVSEFDGVTDNVGNLQQQSVSVPETIHFYTQCNTFVAFADGKYYNNWADSAEYGTQTEYGIAPEQGKFYFNRSTNNEHRWTGEALITINAFLDDYVSKLGIKRDQNTGLYTLHGLTDITYEQMVKIVSAGRMTGDNPRQQYCLVGGLRTHLPVQFPWSVVGGDLTFFHCEDIEVVDAPLFYPQADEFCECRKLRKATVYNINSRYRSYPGIYKGCSALEELVGGMASVDLWLGDSPLLTLATFKDQIIGRYDGSKAIIITVHPDVYAKMTDESNAEWHALLAAAEAKNISFATI